MVGMEKALLNKTKAPKGITDKVQKTKKFGYIKMEYHFPREKKKA